jgi:hypothetical protein
MLRPELSKEKRAMRKLFAAALLVLAACSDSTGPNAHVGAYALTSINGVGLPVIVDQDATGTLEITAGLVTLSANGTFTDRTDFRETTGSQVFTDFDVTTGSYEINGNNITFFPNGGGSYSMAFSGETLTQVEPGFTLVYEK